MIRELVEYTERRGLGTKLGYVAKSARWSLNLSVDGSYLGLIELGDPDERKTSGITFALVPQLEQNELIVGGVIRSHFLLDTLAVVADWHVADDDKNHRKHEFFVQLLRDASTGTPILAAWAHVLSDESVLDRIRVDARNQKARPTDRVTLQCGGKYIVEDDSWHDWWDGFRATLKGGSHDASEARCLITGTPGPVVATHPKISGLNSVGGASTGSVLVSFDKAAFSSYGLEQGNNAPMSEHVVVAYQSALNDLLKRGIDIGGMKVVYWYKETMEEENDPIGQLFKLSDESLESSALAAARETLTGVYTGRLEHADTENRYYVALLSAVSARVMVRAWHEGSYDEIRRNVVQWFNDLSLVRRDGSPGRSPSFQSIVRRLSIGDRQAAAPHVRSLWESAMFGRPIGEALARLALAKVHHDVITGDPVPDRVVAVLKAFIIRKKGTVAMEMSSALDVDRPEPAYQLGRLLAVLASLQTTGHRQVRSGLPNRYYASASTMPALVFGRLLNLAEHHLNRVESPRLRQWWRNQITEVMNRISSIPRTLAVEEQALFALGYYHQLAKPRVAENTGEENEDVAAD